MNKTVAAANEALIRINPDELIAEIGSFKVFSNKSGPQANSFGVKFKDGSFWRVTGKLFNEDPSTYIQVLYYLGGKRANVAVSGQLPFKDLVKSDSANA